MIPVSVIALAAFGVLLLSKPRTYPVAQSARNTSSTLQQQANKVRNTAIAVQGSINDAGAAIGSVAETTARIVDSISSALNLGAASLSEYGTGQTQRPLYSGSDPYVISNGFGMSAEAITVDEGGTNALDPSFYDAANTVNA